MPACTGERSRAVDDRGRSSSSSDQGSAIEGFRQKISLHDKLPDLGMQLRQLRVAVLIVCTVLLVKHLRELLDCLALPRCNLVGCRPCLVASSATVSWPLIASSA